MDLSEYKIILNYEFLLFKLKVFPNCSRIYKYIFDLYQLSKFNTISVENTVYRKESPFIWFEEYVILVLAVIIV